MTGDTRELMATLLREQEAEAGVSYRTRGSQVHVCLDGRALCGQDLSGGDECRGDHGPRCHDCSVRCENARLWALAQATALFEAGLPRAPDPSLPVARVRVRR